MIQGFPWAFVRLLSHASLPGACADRGLAWTQARVAGTHLQPLIRSDFVSRVVGIVVNPHQPLRAVGIGKHPRAESLLNELVFLAGGHRCLLVDDALFAIAVVDDVVDHRRLHVECQLEEVGAVGAGRAVLGGRGDGLLRGVVRVQALHRILPQMSDRHRG
jgi:hypothetical protein